MTSMQEDNSDDNFTHENYPYFTPDEFNKAKEEFNKCALAAELEFEITNKQHDAKEITDAEYEKKKRVFLSRNDEAIAKFNKKYDDAVIYHGHKKFYDGIPTVNGKYGWISVRGKLWP